MGLVTFDIYEVALTIRDNEDIDTEDTESSTHEVSGVASLSMSISIIMSLLSIPLLSEDRAATLDSWCWRRNDDLR